MSENFRRIIKEVSLGTDRSIILRVILLLSIVITISYPLLVYMIINPAYLKSLHLDTQEYGELIVDHLSKSVEERLFSPDMLNSPEIRKEISLIEKSFLLDRLFIYSPTAELIYPVSFDEMPPGYISMEGISSRILKGPKKRFQIINQQADGENQRGKHIAEGVIPVTTEEATIGWVVIYIDVTEKLENFTFLLRNSALFSVCFSAGFLIVVIYLLNKAGKAVQEIEAAENEKKRLNQELELRIEERIKELKETSKRLRAEIEERDHVELRLKDAKHQAELANVAKSDFLANISHELRTPMHGILSFAKLGLRRIDKMNKEGIVDFFNEIHNAGQRLLFLLNDLLDLSKLESGKTKFEMECNSVPTIIDMVVAEYKALINEKKLKLTIQTPEIPTEVECDKFRIGQVIRNLLSNAIKFTPPGKEIMIAFESTKIALEPRLKTYSPALKVIVRDSGVGIPNEELNSVFDKFIQSSRIKNETKGGTGLGLAICKQIVESHRGKIWAQPNPEGGAVFQFAIPYKQHEENRY